MSHFGYLLPPDEADSSPTGNKGNAVALQVSASLYIPKDFKNQSLCIFVCVRYRQFPNKTSKIKHRLAHQESICPQRLEIRTIRTKSSELEGKDLTIGCL